MQKLIATRILTAMWNVVQEQIGVIEDNELHSNPEPDSLTSLMESAALEVFRPDILMDVYQWVGELQRKGMEEGVLDPDTWNSTLEPDVRKGLEWVYNQMGEDIMMQGEWDSDKFSQTLHDWIANRYVDDPDLQAHLYGQSVVVLHVASKFFDYLMTQIRSVIPEDSVDE